MNTRIFAIMMIVPWVATLAGSLLGVTLKLGSQKRQGALLGFAAGVMIASSVWSLIIPAFDESGGGWGGALLATAGFVLGCLGMLGLDRIVPHQHMTDDAPEGVQTHLSRPMLLVLAVALHNIPEGLALGVLIGALLNETSVTATGALAFAAGLALQNLPEGMAVVLPMRQAGVSIRKCRMWGILASFAEPLAALIGLGATSLLVQLGPVIMPVLLAMAAGAMIFIVVEELIPESQNGSGSHTPTYGFLIGFWAMAVMGILGS